MESKTEGAKQASDTFEKKADATKRAQDIADNRGTKVIEHNKMKHHISSCKPLCLDALFNIKVCILIIKLIIKNNVKSKSIIFSSFCNSL